MYVKGKYACVIYVNVCISMDLHADCNVCATSRNADFKEKCYVHSDTTNSKIKVSISVCV